MNQSPPPPAADPKGSGPIFYGWKVVAVAFIADFIAVGFFFYSFGVFFVEIANDLGGSRFSASIGVSVSNVVGAIAAPFLGRALDRFPIKRIMLLGTASVSSGFALLSGVSSQWEFYLVLGTFTALGMSSMGGLSSSKLVSNWFVARRGTALGIATVGVSLSGLVMPAIATWLLAHLGWRGSFQVYALCTVAVVAPIVAIFVVNRPEDIGLEPDGADPPELSGPRPFVGERAWTTGEIVRSRNFWVIAACFSMVLASLSAILIHMVPYADDLGVSGYRAASILSLSAGAGVLGKVVFGSLVDRVDARVAVWSSFGAQIGGVLLLLLARDYAGLVTAAVIFGFGMGGAIPLQGAVTGAAFGRISFGRVMGLIRPVQVPIHAAGIPLAGWIRDTTGSYAPALTLFIGLYLVAGVAIAALKLESKRPASSGSESGGETGLA